MKIWTLLLLALFRLTKRLTDMKQARSGAGLCGVQLVRGPRL